MNYQRYALLINLCITFTHTSYNGYCKVPLADLLGTSIQTLSKNSDTSTQELYEQLPKNTKKNDYTCPRIAQLVYNDPVKILEYKQNEVHIATPQWRYGSGKHTYTHYWTRSEWIGTITDTNKHAHPHSIPGHQSSQSIVVLIKPWYCKKLRVNFSVGTRFVIKEPVVHGSYYKVWCEYHDTIHTLHIPKEYAQQETSSQSPAQKKSRFVALLRTWAHTTPAIPYVLGGSSYMKQAYDTVPYAGFDCAKLISRAAQLCNIPLYAANSNAFLQLVAPVPYNAQPENGDIIYFKGHVAIISDVTKGLMIESRGYGDVNGIVQEIPFSDQFKDIITSHDLMHAYTTHQHIIRLDKNHTKTQTIYDLQLLRLLQ